MRIRGIAEEHTFVSAGLFFFAYTARLGWVREWSLQSVNNITLGAAPAGLRSMVALGPDGVAKAISRYSLMSEGSTYMLGIPL